MPDHCREITTCSPSTFLDYPQSAEFLGWMDIGLEPAQPSYGFNSIAVT